MGLRHGVWLPSDSSQGAWLRDALRRRIHTGMVGALLLCQALSAAPSDGSRKQAFLAGRRGRMLSLLAFDTRRERGCNGHRIALGPARRGGAWGKSRNGFYGSRTEQGIDSCAVEWIPVSKSVEARRKMPAVRQKVPDRNRRSSFPVRTIQAYPRLLRSAQTA